MPGSTKTFNPLSPDYTAVKTKGVVEASGSLSSAQHANLKARIDKELPTLIKTRLKEFLPENTTVETSTTIETVGRRRSIYDITITVQIVSTEGASFNITEPMQEAIDGAIKDTVKNCVAILDLPISGDWGATPVTSTSTAKTLSSRDLLCPPHRPFMCADMSDCISNKLKCDGGDPDCFDGSDEENCPGPTSSTTTINTFDDTATTSMHSSATETAVAISFTLVIIAGAVLYYKRQHALAGDKSRSVVNDQFDNPDFDERPRRPTMWESPDYSKIDTFLAREVSNTSSVSKLDIVDASYEENATDAGLYATPSSPDDYAIPNSFTDPAASLREKGSEDNLYNQLSRSASRIANQALKLGPGGGPVGVYEFAEHTGMSSACEESHGTYQTAELFTKPIASKVVNDSRRTFGGSSDNDTTVYEKPFGEQAMNLYATLESGGCTTDTTDDFC